MKKKYLLIITFFIFLFGVGACSKPETKEEIKANIILPQRSVDNTKDSQFIYVEISGSWTLSINADWARVNKNSGTNSCSAIELFWDENNSTETRTCIITLKGNTEASVELTQRGKEAVNPPIPDYTGIQTSIPAKWLELPATDRSDLYFITHDMTINDEKTRNFSYYYDINAMLALWVAYPLNKGLMAGGSGRTDDWGFDPKVPVDFQQELHHKYKGGSYDRGHQIPSADRQTIEANRQTFYYTNMTPQVGALNQKQWANLEGKVRNWAESSDTLYVVTGADFANSKTYALDNNGTKIPVPTAYFKALLSKIGTKYRSIGFYYEHREYSNEIMEQSMTIDELEEKLGIDFFVNLPYIVGQTAADETEAKIDTWWKSN